MANAKTIEFILKAIGDFGDVTNNINTIQNSLKQLKLPPQLKQNFTNVFSELQKETAKYQSYLNSGFKTKGDVTGLEKTGNKINALLVQLQTNMSKIDPSILKESFTIDTSQFKELNSEIEKTQQKLSEIVSTADFSNLTTGVSNVVNEMGKLTKSKSLDEFFSAFKSGDIDQARIALERLTANASKFKENSKNAEDYATYLELLKKSFQSLEKVEGLRKVNDDLNDLNVKLQNLSDQQLQDLLNSFAQGKINVEQFKQAVQNYTNASKEAAEKTFELSSGIDQFKNKAKYFLGLENVINLFKRALQQALETVKELDAVMTETAVVTDFTVGDMWEKLPEYATQASTLGASIKDLYSATTLYYQQGLKTEQAMGVGVETMKMARIANLEAGDATKYMTAALRGFNMEVDELNSQRVNDVYSELAAITAADTSQIATAMSKTASIAKAANMEFETTAALLAQIIETTQEAPETAGTALKTIIARFAEVKELRDKGLSSGEDEEGEAIDVNKIQAALRSVGISMEGFFAGTEGLDSILMKLAEKWGDLDFETQRYIATMAAGSRQQSRFIAMMSDYERTMELTTAANNSAGASQEQFDKTLESIEAKLQRLDNAWKEFVMGLANNELLKIGIDILTGFLNVINTIIGALAGGNGLSKSVITLTTAILAIKGASSLVAKFFSSNFLKTATAAFKKIKTVAQETSTEIKTSLKSGITEGLESADEAYDAGYKAGQEYTRGYNDGSKGTEYAEPSKPQKQPGGTVDTKIKDNAANSSKDIEGASQATSNLSGATKAATASSLRLTSAITMLAGTGLNWGATAVKAKDETSAFGAGLEAAGSAASIAGAGLGALIPVLLEAGVALGPVIGVVIGLVAAVGLLGAGIKAAYNASLEGRIEAAEKATERAKTAAEETKQAYDELLSSKNVYDELQLSLDGLTEGTRAWKETLQQSNDEILKLIELYPELKDAVVYGEKGRLSFDEEKYNNFVEQKQQQAANAQITLASNQIEETYLKSLTSLPESASYQMTTEKWGALVGKYQENENLFSNKREVTWEELEKITGGNGKEMAKRLSNSGREITYDEELEQFYVVSDAGGMPIGFMQEDVMAEWVDSVTIFNDDLYDLAESCGIAADVLYGLEASVDNYEKTAALQIYSGLSAQLTSDELESESSGAVMARISKNYSDDLQTKVNEVLENFDITAIAESYDLKGRNDSDATYKEVYEKATGQSADNLEIEQIKKELAQLEVFKELKGKSSDVIRKIDARSEHSQKFLRAGVGLDASELTQSDLKTFASDFLAQARSAGIDPAMLGYESYKEMQKDIYGFIEEAKAEFTEISSRLNIRDRADRTLRDYAQEGLILEDYRTYSDLIGKALLAGGTDLADSFKANFDSVLNNPDLAPDMKEKFLNLLNTVDLTSEGSIEAFLQELQKIGIETEKVGIDKLVEDLEKLGYNLERVNLKGLLEDTQTLLKLRNEIVNGDKGSLTDEEYQTLISNGVAQASDFFWNGEEWVYMENSMQDLARAIDENTSAILNQKVEALDYQIESGQEFERWATGLGSNHKVSFLAGRAEGLGADIIRGAMGEAVSGKSDAEVLEMYRQGYLNYTQLTTNEEQRAMYAQQAEQATMAADIRDGGLELDSENLNKQTAAIDAVARSTEGAMGQYAKWMDEMDDDSVLKDKEAELKQLAILSTKYANSVDDLAEVLSDEIDVLKKGPKAGDKYYKSLEKVAEEAQKVFGSKIDAKYVAENKDLFIQLAKGGKEGIKAFKQIARDQINAYNQELQEKGLNSLSQEQINTLLGFADKLKVGEPVAIKDAFGDLAETIKGSEEYKEFLRLYGVVVDPNGLVTKVEDGSKGFKIKTPGGSGSKSKWENPYDKFYNTLREINEELRIRERLERRYQKLIDTRTANANELFNISQKELKQLEKEAELQEYLKKGRQEQMDELVAKKSKKFGKYVQVTEGENGEREIRIDWEKIDKIRGTKKGEQLEKYISQLEEWEDSIEEANDTLSDIEDTIYEINERGKEEFLDVENRTKDALVNVYQKQIDKLSDINESINDTNSRLLDAMQESIEQERQARENEKTEEELSDKQRRLAYLRQDTSGANALEIMQLEKELDEGMESYTDQLIDQKISELQKQNDKAAEQRERQIEIAQAQLDHYVETGAIWSEVDELMKNYLDPNSGPNGKLLELLKESEEFESLSKLGKEEWTNDLGSAVAQALAYVKGINQLENLNMAGNTIEFTDADGNSYSGTVDDKGNITLAGKDGAPMAFANVYKNLAGEYVTDETAGEATEKAKKYYTASNGDKILVSAIEDELSTESKRSNDVRALQSALNELGYREGNIDGKFGPNTKKSLKKFQEAEGLDDTGKLDESTKEKFRLKGYKTGGLADFTGPAWLDGTKARPEYILNADQTKSFFELVDVLSGLRGGINTNSQITGDRIYDVDINVESIGSDYDVEQIADVVKRMITDNARYRNNNAINLMR